MTNTQALPDLKLVAVGDLRPSTTNPRKDFDSPKAKKALEDLKDSIIVQGICQPILARPKPGATPFELVAGERRYRAALLAGFDVVPVIIRELSDSAAEEIQVVENLQRSDLTELEEAESYHRLLALKGDDGQPRYTMATLGQRFGIDESTIRLRLCLLNLDKQGQAALAGGEIGARQAVLVARIPDPAARTEALKLVLAPQHKKEPLTFLETKELISEKFMQGLGGAPFKLDDAKLLETAGACSTCPKMTDNCAQLFSAEEAQHFKKKKICTDPTCFRAKLAAMWKARTAEAEAAGATVLSEKQSKDIYPTWQSTGEIAWDTTYVELNKKPAADLIKPEVQKVGTWRSLIEAAEKKTGQKVPRVLARDQAGVPRELVDRKLAIVAIETAGEPIFQGKVGNRVTSGSDDFAKQRKKELEAAKLRLAQSLEGMTQMHAKLVAMWQPSPIWESIFEVAMGHAGADGLWLVGKWKGLKFDAHNTGKEEAVAKWAMTLPPAERQALVPLLLIGQSMKWSGLCERFEQIVQGAGLGLDLKAIERTVAANLKAEKTAKKAKAKEPKAQKKTKAEKKAEADAAAAAPYEWNEAGRAAKADAEEPMGQMPEGTKCIVLLALAPDGKWRYGLDLESRMTGKESRKGLPALAGPSFGGGSAWDDALMAAFTEALAFFKDDPAAFRVIAHEADEDVVEALEGEGGAAPVAAKPEKTSRAKITAQIEEQVRALHSAGKTMHEIGKALGISAPSVQNIKKKLGLIQPKAAATPPPELVNFSAEVPADDTAKLSQWVKAYTDGMPIEEIARSFGATVEDVRGALEIGRVLPSPIPAAIDLAPEVVQELLRYDDAGDSLEAMCYLTHLPRDTVRAALRAAGRDKLKCEGMSGEVNIEAAREQLLAALKELAPGSTDTVRATILAKYAKRVGSEGSVLEDLTYAEIMKIIAILGQAKAGRQAA